MDLKTQEVHLSHYWNVVHKRWKVALSILSVVMLGTLLASYFAKPLYRSSIQIQIERENPNQMTVDDLFGIAASDQEFLQTQYVVLRSRGLLQRVIDEHKLLLDPEFYPAGIQGNTPERNQQIRDSMVGALASGQEVQPVKNTSLVEIHYTTTSPRLARKVAEGIGESYMRMNTEQKFESVRAAGEFLDRQIAQIRRDIDQTRSQMQKYGASTGLISTDDANSMSATRILKDTTDFQNSRNARIEKQGVYDSIARSSPDTIAAGDPLVAQLTAELASQQRDYDQKLATFKPDYPQMISLRASIEQIRRARVSAVVNAYARRKEEARRDLEAAQQAENQMSSGLESQRRTAMSVNASAAGLVDLSRTLSSKQDLLAQLEKRQNETEVTARLRGSSTSNIHWVDHAQVPARFNVTMKRNLQSAFPLGVVLGLAAIFFLEYMDRSIKTPEELERVTSFASLGVIPSANSLSGRAYGYGASRGSANLRPVSAPSAEGAGGIDLLPHLDSRSPIAEAYRAFRTSLLLASASSPKIMVITSTFAREGKTTTSVNLATVLAQMGKPVLLIDADLRRPRLQKIFRGKSGLGLVNYLASSTPIDDVIQDSVVPNLSIILSGPTPPNPSELLASDRMKTLLHELRSRFAFVIFDSPPVMAVTDSLVLGANADGVVLCVHGGQTPRELVQRAAERLRQSKIPVLGALLNNLDLQQYGYSFKKNYYDYYDSDQGAAKNARVS